MNLAKPEFHLARVQSDGSSEVEIVSVTGLELDTRTDRRGFLGAAATVGSVLAGSAFAQAPATRPQGAATVPEPATATPAPGTAPVKKGGAPARPSPAAKPDPNAKPACGPADLVGINAIALSPDGRTLASATAAAQIKLWRVSDGKLIRTLQAQPVAAIAFSRDGKKLAVATINGEVQLWGLDDGKLIRALESRYYYGSGAALAFSHDGMLLAAGGNDRAVRLWHHETGTLLRTLTENPAAINALTFMPGDQILIAGCGTRLRFWNPQTGESLTTISDSKVHVNAIVARPDGQSFVAGGSNWGLKLWRIPEAREFTWDRLLDGSWLRTLREQPQLAEQTSHKDTTRALAITADGRMIATGGFDKIVRLWRLPDLAPVNAFEGHEGEITSLAFTPNGSTLISASLDKTIRMWPVVEGPMQTWQQCFHDPKAVPKPAPRPPTQGSPGSSGTYGTGGTYCSCNKVCVCIPVRCQAHRLLDADPIVRTMAREILLLVGTRELDYMHWAADQAAPALHARIDAVIDEVCAGVQPDPACWPSTRDCIRMLDHSDDIVALMAAEMLLVRRCRDGERLEPAIDSRATARVEAARGFDFRAQSGATD